MTLSTRREFLQQSAVLAGGLGSLSAGGWAAAADQPQVSPEELARLRAKLKGRLVSPGDAAYEDAKRVFYWNPRTARTPVAVVQCAQEEDVVRAVEFAQRHQLEVAVRSGGHSHLAWGSSNGLVIDLSSLKHITIDPARRLVRAQAGVVGSEVARAAGKYGLVPVLGQCPGVSATGVTLGGGLGWLSGLFGACCDNLVSARLVTAEAHSMEVRDDSEPELFWGLRGAGANFGVTTSFEAQLQTLGTVLGGDVHFATRDARSVLRGFREIMQTAPDEFQATLNLTPGKRGLFISLCHAGTEQAADGLLRKLRTIATPIQEVVQRLPFSDFAQRAAATNPGVGNPPAFRGIQTVYRECITDEIIEILIEQLAHAAPEAIMGLSHYMHGAVCRVKPADTAFPHRLAHAIHLRVALNWSDPELSEQHFAWLDEWLRGLRPQSSERLYANYQTYNTDDGAAALFGPNHARLLALKKKYDPTNFFHRNANIALARS
jgi:FAD/FMN-containing dehydrogenase